MECAEARASGPSTRCCLHQNPTVPSFLPSFLAELTPSRITCPPCLPVSGYRNPMSRQRNFPASPSTRPSPLRNRGCCQAAFHFLFGRAHFGSWAAHASTYLLIFFHRQASHIPWLLFTTLCSSPSFSLQGMSSLLLSDTLQSRNMVFVPGCDNGFQQPHA
ncbi:hypothetical protein PMIN03_012612 [Paraphaeosphaeria minitans]